MTVRGVLPLSLMLTLSTLLTGCIGLLGKRGPAPNNVGPHRVGVTTIQVEDETRDRELDVEVWYPASSKVTTASSLVYRLKAAGTIVARLSSRVGAQRNAKVFQQHGALPVVLFSHGAGSTRYGNVTLAEVLASHGYIVAAPDHDGHTTSDKVFGISNEERAQSALDRPLDLSRVLDELARRSRDDHSLLHQAVDLKRVAVAGHSFGGRAALGMVGARFDAQRQARECEGDDVDRRCLAVPVFGTEPYRYRDDRVKAALLITPAGFKFYRADGIAKVDAPVLVVGADRDETTPYEQFHKATFEALEGERQLLELENAGHLTATDVCSVIDSIGFLAKAVGGKQAQDGCGAGYISPDEARDRVVSAALPFLDRHLGS